MPLYAAPFNLGLDGEGVDTTRGAVPVTTTGQEASCRWSMSANFRGKSAAQQ
jgi:hypothetical protein